MVSRAIIGERPLDAIEREVVVHLLDESDWKLQECANRLKVSRTTLWRRMKRLGIKRLERG